MSEIGIIWFVLYLLLTAGIIKIFLKILSKADTSKDFYEGIPKLKKDKVQLTIMRRHPFGKNLQ